MKPIGPLMHEHRLIERMIKLMKLKLDEAIRTNSLDSGFIDSAVDFIRIYADRCHHGKEEDILFRDLACKQLSGEHTRIMNELVSEHMHARSVVRQLVSAKERYQGGDAGAVDEAAACIRELAEFYPVHILKEDKQFFFPILNYFNQEEQDKMLQEFWEFDRQLIHEKYRSVVEHFEATIKS
jgi:hemerythrin-like domain-containing protein